MSLHHFLLHSTQPLLLTFFCPEQGRRNDLLSKYDDPIPQDDRSLLSTPACSTNIKSDSVHCDPLSCVASGSRCHTADYLKEMKDVDSSVPCLNSSILKSGSWMEKPKRKAIDPEAAETRNKMSTTNVSELGYLFYDKSSLHIIAWDLDVERSQLCLGWCKSRDDVKSCNTM